MNNSKRAEPHRVLTAQPAHAAAKAKPIRTSAEALARDVAAPPPRRSSRPAVALGETRRRGLPPGARERRKDGPRSGSAAPPTAQAPMAQRGTPHRARDRYRVRTEAHSATSSATKGAAGVLAGTPAALLARVSPCDGRRALVQLVRARPWVVGSCAAPSAQPDPAGADHTGGRAAGLPRKHDDRRARSHQTPPTETVRSAVRIPCKGGDGGGAQCEIRRLSLRIRASVAAVMRPSMACM